jgi:hypothetical protein
MAARLTETFEISEERPGIVSCVVVTSAEGADAAAADALRADWVDASCIETAALHRSLGGEGLVELIQWSGSREALTVRARCAVERVREAAPACCVGTHVLALNGVRPGPKHRGPGHTLEVNSASCRPVLIGIFDPVHRGQAALMQYLQEASVRLAAEVDGWIGAALYRDESGRQIVEYLQFEGMDAVAASQGSPTILSHQAELQKFGSVAANLYMVGKVFRRQASEDDCYARR